MTAARQYNNLLKLRANLIQTASEAANEHTQEMADLNREQLIQGKDSSGTSMRRYASPAYADLKNTMNPSAGLFNPDLKLTGATHASIRFQVINGTIKNLVNDQYGLEEKYSTPNSNPFLLTKESKVELNTTLRKTFIEKCKKILSQ